MKDAAEIVRYQPAFEHSLIDLSQVELKQVCGDLIGKLALGLMKSVADDTVLQWIEHAAPLMAELLHRSDAPGILDTLLRYLMTAESSVNLEMLDRAVTSGQSAEMRGRVMSIAEQLKAEGRQEGRQEGAVIELSDRLDKQKQRP